MRPPAFQFYAKDFTAGTVDLSTEEVGAYMRLLCYQWDKGAVPADVTARARITGCSRARMASVWANIRRHFIEQSDGSFLNARLERERQKQDEFRRKQSDKARASASSRASAKPEASLNRASTEPQPSRNQGPAGLRLQPEGNSSICDLRSADCSQERTNHVPSRVRDFPKRDEPLKPESVEARAGVFCQEIYPALYAKLRKGARYISKPTLDFQEALELCRVWDDERLLKIATVFLTTDHDFAEKGSRTIAQFRALASWCDSRLAEAGIA